MSRIITKEDVKKHNNKRTVWVIIHNEVYDVTKFLDEVGYLFNYLNKPLTNPNLPFSFIRTASV